MVAEILPGGYPRYVRVFHPFLPSGSDHPDYPVPGSARTWRSLAEEAGVVFHAEIAWESLIDVLGGRRAQTRPFWVSEGRLDEPARSALFGLLTDRGPSAAYFLYHMGAMARGRPPLLFRAAVADFGLVQTVAEEDLGDRSDGAPTPEWVWPMDRSWVVNTDYDLVSTFVACDSQLADAILASERCEALPCATLTRVDAGADQINRRT